ncbi:aminoglycoside phosphotransferase family protein [Spirosoma flavus]
MNTQFPEWSTLPIKAVEFSGWDNRTFHLGDLMTVRLPSAEGYKPQAEKEQYWLPRLAPHLPVSIPTLLAKGEPDTYFPAKWGIYRWIDGENATLNKLANVDDFARSVAHFLRTLQRIDPAGGPLAGSHSWFRGASLSVYDHETRRSIKVLQDKIDVTLAEIIWQEALASIWQNPPVWFHGDIASGNLLIKNGRLEAVIDFGCCGIGDPACDLVIAWTMLSGRSREIFRAEVVIDDATWARGRGWALWKALITIEEYGETGNKVKTDEAWKTINELFGEYRLLNK